MTTNEETIVCRQCGFSALASQFNRQHPPGECAFAGRDKLLVPGGKNGMVALPMNRQWRRKFGKKKER